MKKIIVAIDSFKGCMSSAEANGAVAERVHQVLPDAEIIQIPVADGGEGWLEAFQSALGGELREIPAHDPLMRPMKAAYLVKGETAVIEIAQASGLPLLTKEERNPLVATSYGTGELVADAIKNGCKHIIVGLGGSATSDCGKGMLRAIIDKLASGGSWDDVEELKDVRFTIASDVTNPLCGENGAAYVFAPQKGATPEMVFQLDEQARKFAEISAKHFGFDRQDMPGAGAAGGLGYAFLQYMGEGSADRQTLMGKLPFGILKGAQAKHVPVALMAGRIQDSQILLDAGFAYTECINPEGITLEEAMNPETAKANIARTALEIINKQ